MEVNFHALAIDWSLQSFSYFQRVYHFDSEDNFEFKSALYKDLAHINHFPLKEFFSEVNMFENQNKLRERNGYRYGILTESYLLNY
jgi:hypothetical protein